MVSYVSTESNSSSFGNIFLIILCSEISLKPCCQLFKVSEVLIMEKETIVFNSNKFFNYFALFWHVEKNNEFWIFNTASKEIVNNSRIFLSLNFEFLFYIVRLQRKEFTIGNNILHCSVHWLNIKLNQFVNRIIISIFVTFLNFENITMGTDSWINKYLLFASAFRLMWQITPS